MRRLATAEPEPDVVAASAVRIWVRVGSVLASHPLVRMLVRRLLATAALLLVVTALTFVLVSLIPGDTARVILGREATPEAYQQLREALGLDLPLYQQYGGWLSEAVTGDLGSSLFSGQPVSRTIHQRLPVTLSLMVGALTVSVLVGVTMGAVGAVRGGRAGRLVDAIALVGFALPAFWVGAMLISVFAVKLGWLPPTGYTAVTESPGLWARSLALPVAALGMGGAAAVAKHTRDAMLDALASEYIRVAWASGISPRSIYLRHALKNSSVRVVTILGLQAVGLLGGTVVVESLFALPGLGSLAVKATADQDLPMIQGVVVYFTLLVVVINLLVDLSYVWLNPKARRP